MDKVESASNIIIKINQFSSGELHDYDLIREVCTYFDSIKSEQLSDADRQFLFYIANMVGIPQYYDTLIKFHQNTQIDNISLQVLSDSIKESTLFTSNDIKIHQYQKNILDRFSLGIRNRYFLSASTSFGKTFLAYEVIRKMKYNNVLLLFPSIALLSENLEKIYSDSRFIWVKEKYKIHTITSISEMGENNLFLYTPERYLSFLDISALNTIKFDFIFVDEVYKIDNDYIVDEEVKENERDVAYRLALFYALSPKQTDCLLVGPYIKFGELTDSNYNPSFNRFLNTNDILLLDYNKYDIVNKERIKISSRGGKIRKYIEFIQEKTSANENVIVYCSQKSDTESYAKKIVEDSSFPEIDVSPFEDFFLHITSIFNSNTEWIVAKALRKGVGIHHGLVPKYIQKEIINLFNMGYIKILLSTTTITEGVNTTAKNVLILSHKKGGKDLKVFDAKNIEGRAGRFLQHYKGSVYFLDNEYEKIINSDEEPIKHKNYDENAPKQDVDLYFSDITYLVPRDLERKVSIDSLQQSIGIPDSILNQFKVISKMDKLKMYQSISNLTRQDCNLISELIKNYSINSNITFKGFDVIIDVVFPFVRHARLSSYMQKEYHNQHGSCKLLTILVYTYFKYGLIDMVSYSHNHSNKSIDVVVRDIADFVYNILKYQVVKYFGAFNLMYKYYISKIKNIAFEDVTGIDAILLRMEYNAKTQKGRVASDYGVPQRVLNYYDADENEKILIMNNFDKYELSIFNKIDNFITD